MRGYAPTAARYRACLGQAVQHAADQRDRRIQRNLEFGRGRRICVPCGRGGESNRYVDEMVYEYRRNADSAVRSFSNDYVRRTISAIETMRDTIRQFREISDGTLDDYTLFHLTIIMINDLFNPEAPWNRHERKNHYGKVVNMPVFRQPLDRYRGGRFPVTRQIALLSMKYRWYYVSAAIAWVRHKQFSGKQ
mgnify:CR=1 FL=1